MRHSLKLRILIAVAVPLITAIATLALVSSLGVKREFDRFLVAEQRQQDGVMTRRIAEAFRRDGEEGLRSTLRDASSSGRELLVVDSAGRIVVASPDRAKQWNVKLLPQGLELSRDSGTGRELIRLRMRGIAMIDGRGRRFGTLYALPAPDRGPRNREQFGGSVDRRLVTGVAVVALISILLAFSLVRRLMAPIEELKRGSAALASGKLDTRVEAKGSDEFAQLGAAFNKMAESLERHEASRRRLVSDVAHELRTPLTNVRCQIEAVEDGLMPLDSTFLGSMYEEMESLSRIVDDLQQLSLADAGQLCWTPEIVSIRDLLQRAIDGVTARAATGSVSVRLDCDAGLMGTLDPQRLTQVMRNLLVNAVTHAHSAVIVSATGDGSRLMIRVADDGAGVSIEDSERIFDRFYRTDASRTRATGGSGLGLAIARELVVLHRGTIELERAARGASFLVTIPQP